MKRVNPAGFPAKFQRHGILPQQGAFITKDRGQCYACALGLEAIDATDLDTARAVFPYPDDQQPRDDSQNPVADLAKLAGLPSEYAAGLSDGWEDIGMCGVESDLYVLGWYDGHHAYEACQIERLI
jgi:hypothetical protein